MGAEADFRITTAKVMRRFFWTVLAGTFVQSGSAEAFPLLDPSNQNTLPGTADLAGTDTQDLTHHLQIANGMPTLTGNVGWAIQPRLSMQEQLTDNVLQVHSPMRWDLTTLISPGIAINGNTPRAQVRLDYAPVVIINARTGNQNALNQQLNANATITAIDEWAFLDLRAVSGIQSLRGAAGYGGSIGASDLGGITAGANGILSNGVPSANLQDQQQTASFGISPYVFHEFGDFGTVKLGYSYNLSQSSPVTGFKLSPFPTGGSNTQRLTSNEQTFTYRSGDFLNDFQDTVDVDFLQSTSSSQFGGITPTGQLIITPTSFTSSRQTISNALNYAVTRSLTLTVSVGHETIKYSGNSALNIDDLTWSVGGTWVPNPNSSLTLSYGHQQGADSFAFNGRYQLTPRTAITASYTDTLGTQLENLQRQLNQGVVGPSGTFINGQTGGPLFGSTNQLPVQPGVFRFKTFSASANTEFSRDTVSATVTVSNQVSSGAAVTGQTTSQSTGLSLQWSHDMRPDLRWTTAASYNVVTGGFGGNSTSFAFNTGLLYTLSESLSASVRYSFFRTTSQNALFSLYEDIFVVGVTKTF
jgi:uncharacterized protein (PEP-CTERM system associated)